ncbi:ABC transporter permease [Microvirga guangxiensis]|uniref:Osmoprotectant transport system permease protein n=1 Tax=Microvirga guangxiensis TaxID=549386 RepID=A0A1G5E1K1_9HYPH|nr:ABC transporter permease [Microvirga guangxiensis]SCY20899.1 osmoprotectant transport system permease protein [Microvirga guangxiensis]
MSSATSRTSTLGVAPPPRPTLSFDHLGCVIAIIIGIALFAAPFATYRATRIASGEARFLIEALPIAMGTVIVVVSLGVAVVAVLVRDPFGRLGSAVIGLAVLLPALGLSAGFLTPADNTFARVSPSLGFWLLTLSFSLLAIDALARLRLGPYGRLVALAVGVSALALLLFSGIWDSLSILKEYHTRADTFWREARQHLLLAFGSMAAACIIGIPLGIAAYRLKTLRTALLQGLGIVQTIPSIALFGLLMAPLGAIAASVPLAAALGIKGIGAAPAFIALFLYALFPIVANTIAGLSQVPAAAVDAARGMGMSARQQLVEIEMPLAFPVILAGIRIVLVQNLGLATVAALIGGGGFGTFVFQGIGQTAIDLVLLGAIPTVALSFASSIFLDALVDLAKGAHA